MLLDEPITPLDLEGKEALAETLGTLLEEDLARKPKHQKPQAQQA